MAITDWPVQERPREKLLAKGANTLSDAELLAVFLRTGTTGMTAVDLGACPGGWTWQLVNRGIRVTAIDNGSMNEKLMETGLVEHLRKDGFTYAPEKTVDWLVCDMVERPMHITHLITKWISEGYCINSVFNLKLPMKKRYQMICDCRQELEHALEQTGHYYQLRMKQLYHDREEITVIILQ